MTETARKVALARYWMRVRNRRNYMRRGLSNRLRRVMFPRARKAGPTFPSRMPSRPDLPKFIFN